MIDWKKVRYIHSFQIKQEQKFSNRYSGNPSLNFFPHPKMVWGFFVPDFTQPAVKQNLYFVSTSQDSQQPPASRSGSPDSSSSTHKPYENYSHHTEVTYLV